MQVRSCHVPMLVERRWSASRLCFVCFVFYVQDKEMMVGDAGNCRGNVKNGHGLYLHDGFLVDMTKTWMRNRPTPNMKKGLLCRNFR